MKTAFAIADHITRFPQEKPSIQIDRGIPIPVGRQCGYNATLRNLLRRMNLGDSFVWEVDNIHVYAVAKELGMKIKTRKLSGDGWRVWRVK